MGFRWVFGGLGKRTRELATTRCLSRFWRFWRFYGLRRCELKQAKLMELQGVRRWSHQSTGKSLNSVRSKFFVFIWRLYFYSTPIYQSLTCRSKIQMVNYRWPFAAPPNADLQSRYLWKSQQRPPTTPCHAVPRPRPVSPGRSVVKSVNLELLPHWSPGCFSGGDTSLMPAAWCAAVVFSISGVSNLTSLYGQSGPSHSSQPSS